MACGCSVTCTEPLAAVTVTGNRPSAAAQEPVSSLILRFVVEDEVRPLRLPGGIGTNRPSSEDRSSTLARRPGLSSGWRHHRCGTAPDSHRLRCAQHHPAELRGTAEAYFTGGAAGDACWHERAAVTRERT